MTMIDEYINYQLEAEKKYGKDTIVFYENGSFYEIYGVDNEKERVGQPKRVSEILNIAMTRKNKKILENSRKNPLLVGVPVAHSEKHIKALIISGMTIVYVEQTTAPPNPERRLTRVQSPSMYIADEYKTVNNYMLSIYFEVVRDRLGKANLVAGLSAFDLTTGDGIFFQTQSLNNDFEIVYEDIFRFMESIDPKEVVINIESAFEVAVRDIECHLELYRRKYYIRKLKADYSRVVYQNEILARVFENKSLLSPLEAMNLEFQPMATMAIMLSLDFIFDHDERILRSLKAPREWQEKKHLILNNNTLYQLNIVRDEMGGGSCLFNILDATKTLMGRRLLKSWMLNPIINPLILAKKYEILDRVIAGQYWLRYDKILSSIIDLERFFRKMSIGYLHPHEMATFEFSLDAIKTILEMTDFSMEDNNFMDTFAMDGSGFMEFYQKFYNTFDLEIMATFNLNDITQSFFKRGVIPELDEVQNLIQIERKFLEEEAVRYSRMIDPAKTDCVKMESNERDGYFLKTTSKRGEALAKKIGADKIRATGANISRIVARELDESNDRLLRAEVEIKNRVRDKFVEWCCAEYRTFEAVFDKVVRFISTVDMTISMAKVSKENAYSRPTIVQRDSSFLSIRGLRHPIIEKINQDTLYIPNDVHLDGDGMLLYGLNGGGKSSLLKAVGLAVIMAQMGMYVPAENMEYSPFKTLYTRIMGNDNIFRGLSSFALEMTELRTILQYSNKNSLILGDEICRGTEMDSAVSIVSSTVSILCGRKANFLFATHLHKLHEIDVIQECVDAGQLRHFYIDLQIENGKILFGRKIYEGVGRKLYGLEVAEHIVENDEFLRIASKVRKQLVECADEIVSSKKSAYNESVYVSECSICHSTADLEVHHVSSQKFADCSGNIDYFHKNHRGNLVVLCADHHRAVHNDGIEIRGWVSSSVSSQGGDRKLDWVEKKKERVHINTGSKGEKFDEHVDKIMEYRHLLKNVGIMTIKQKIKKDLNLEISRDKLKQIFAGSDGSN
jgi:DNA mismatch repair protein MutS